mmetsp:Transcript_6653/g.23481  ORF Transcript_6653/g.23481 Transcript_6653/m.23481 type:complete len:82 (+) Transcript_6653:1265-1510(+)
MILDPRNAGVDPREMVRLRFPPWTWRAAGAACSIGGIKGIGRNAEAVGRPERARPIGSMFVFFWVRMFVCRKQDRILQGRS